MVIDVFVTQRQSKGPLPNQAVQARGTTGTASRTVRGLGHSLAQPESTIGLLQENTPPSQLMLPPSNRALT